MENISFEIAQFTSMPRALKADLIESCINSITNNNSVTIDGAIYTELSEFIYWIFDNV